MSAHKENGSSTKGLERVRNISLGWGALALIFSWELTLPVIFAVAAQGGIEAKKHWGGFKNKLINIFPGSGGHAHAAAH